MYLLSAIRGKDTIIVPTNKIVMNILIETVLWILIIQGFVIAHYFIIVKRNMSPVHWLNLLFAALTAAILSYFFLDTWGFRILNMFYLGFIYWILFPLELNKSRGKPLLYLGDDKDPEEDSVIDKLERKFKNPGGTLGLKVVLMLCCLFILLDL